MEIDVFQLRQADQLHSSVLLERRMSTNPPPVCVCGVCIAVVA